MGEPAVLQETGIKGYYRKVAVGCWFTATGRAIPKLIRYEDEEGVRHMVEDIQVVRDDRGQGTGIMRQRYDCRAVIHGSWKSFILLYHPGENIWDMILPEG